MKHSANPANALLLLVRSVCYGLAILFMAYNVPTNRQALVAAILAACLLLLVRKLGRRWSRPPINYEALIGVALIFILCLPFRSPTAGAAVLAIVAAGVPSWQSPCPAASCDARDNGLE
jgi:drug/metabolite transporter (DMT)-like permease